MRSDERPVRFKKCPGCGAIKFEPLGGDESLVIEFEITAAYAEKKKPIKTEKEIRENLANAKMNLRSLERMGINRNDRVEAIIETLEWILGEEDDSV